MNRRAFLAASIAGATLPRRLPAFAQAERTDPALSSQTQLLRVLLGSGTFDTIDAHTFVFEGRRYRGTAAVLSDGRVIGTLPIEEYLYSVVAREMPRSWPAAALAAQAVLARTYVLQRSNPNRDYDLRPSEADQVYTGIDAEAQTTTAAVDATAGQVLRFAGSFASIAYSSCCGGHTESSASAWGGTPLPYLNGVPCSYCKDSSWYQWTQRLSLDQLRSALSAQSQDIGDLQNIVLDAIDSSGRARYWNFAGSNGSARVKAADIRRLLGTRVLPSLLVRKISLDARGGAALIDGGGLGHGVGFCQWGARGLALTGADAAEIVSFYFPGTAIQAS